MMRFVLGLGIGSVLLLVAGCSDDTAPGNGGSAGAATAGSGGSVGGGGSGSAGTAGSGAGMGGSGAGTAGSAGSGTAGGGAGGGGGASGAGGGGSGGAACETALGKAIKFVGDKADSVAGDLGADATLGDMPRTIELWAKFAGDSSWAGEHSILELGKPSDPDKGNNVFGIDMTGRSGNGGTFGPYTHGVSDNNVGADPLPFLDNTAANVGWLHLSWSYDPSKQDASKRLEFTVNGNVLPTEFNQGKYDATGGKLVGNTGFVLLGGSQNFGKEGWDGVMDEVRLWNVYRTPQQIKDNMKVVVKPTTPGLVAYWQFNEADATNVSDSTGKATHKLSACAQAMGPCSNQNAQAPTFEDSDIPGPFTCGQ